MIIDSLMVEGAGRFARPVTLAGFGPGLNLFCDVNEAGKSTLFRALRTCIFERHGTRAEAVRSLASEGLSLPLTVEVAFSHEGRAWRIARASCARRPLP